MSFEHSAGWPAYLPKGVSASCGWARAAAALLCPSLCRCAVTCFGTGTCRPHLQRHAHSSTHSCAPMRLRHAAP